MRLIHFSDSHLGFAESSKVDSSTGINSREQDVYSAFNGVISQSIKLRPDFVIHAGDLFHSPRPSNRAIVTGFLGVQQLSQAGIPTILVAGNHSVPRVAATGSIFQLLQALPHVQVACNARYEVFDLGEVAVHCIPHIPSEEALRDAMEKVEPVSGKRFNVLVMHGAIRGTGEDYSLGEFNEVGIYKGTLSRFGKFDYIALGHYHKHLRVDANAWYSGSTERFHLKEANYKKGFVEFNLAARKVNFHSISTREILALPTIPCKGKGSSEILSCIERAFATSPPSRDKIVVIRLEQIDPTTWIEVHSQRRIAERDCAADAFEVRWERSLSESSTGKSRSATIGSLAMEFAAFIRTAKTEGLNRERLKRLGERLISDALEAEVTE
jgi:DNA repair exonuclease SbcCD nuclease subunit